MREEKWFHASGKKYISVAASEVLIGEKIIPEQLIDHSGISVLKRIAIPPSPGLEFVICGQKKICFNGLRIKFENKDDRTAFLRCLRDNFFYTKDSATGTFTITARKPLLSMVVLTVILLLILLLDTADIKNSGNSERGRIFTDLLAVIPDNAAVIFYFIFISIAALKAFALWKKHISSRRMMVYTA